MLDRVIGFSLQNRGLVLIAALALVVGGAYQLVRTPVDVFPDLNRPTVTVLTEAPGLAHGGGGGPRQPTHRVSAKRRNRREAGAVCVRHRALGGVG